MIECYNDNATSHGRRSARSDRRPSILRCLALLLLLPVVARARIPDHVQRDAELDGEFKTAAASPSARYRGPIMRELEPLLVQQARYLVAGLQPWSPVQGASTLPLEAGIASDEHGIRPDAHTAKGLALLIRLAPDEAFPTVFSRDTARGHALTILRYLVWTHGAGGMTCADGKPWHNHWQSAYWAAMAGEACWLLWDDLTADERWLAARMVCDEADRFVNVIPPTALAHDTKAEENAWNSEVISLAYNMFPRHPQRTAWRETAIRWIASSFATTQDTMRADLVDGKPLREWIAGANLFDDFTLENHDRMHPDYLACTYLLTSQIPMYAWGANAAPDAINLNAEAINGILKFLSTPEGSVVYPNGQDWGLHRNVDWFEYNAMMAVAYQDRQSAALMRHSLETVRRMAARTPGGAIYLPGETRLPSDQHMMFEYIAHVYALMAQLGEGPEPIADAQLWTGLAGTRVFDKGKFGVVRTTDSVATFSWGTKVMGQVFPLRRDLLLSPEDRGLVGHIARDEGQWDEPTVKETVVANLKSGLGLTGVLLRAGGEVEQRYGFLALPDGRVLYVDHLVLVGTRPPAALKLGTLGVLNDTNWPWHDGTRTLAHEGGSQVFAAANATRESPVELQSTWFNLDSLGIACLDVSGRARYEPAPTGTPGRLEQRFHLDVVAGGSLAQARSGAILAHNVLVFYPNQTATETKVKANRCKLLSVPGDKIIHLRLDDGTDVSFDLVRLKLELNPPAESMAAVLTDGKI